jgi:hypothetical protein
VVDPKTDIAGQLAHFALDTFVHIATKPDSRNRKGQGLKPAQSRLMQFPPAAPESLVLCAFVEKKSDLPCALQREIAMQQVQEKVQRGETEQILRAKHRDGAAGQAPGDAAIPEVGLTGYGDVIRGFAPQVAMQLDMDGHVRVEHVATPSPVARQRHGSQVTPIGSCAAAGTRRVTKSRQDIGGLMSSSLVREPEIDIALRPQYRVRRKRRCVRNAFEQDEVDMPAIHSVHNRGQFVFEAREANRITGAATGDLLPHGIRQASAAQ